MESDGSILINYRNYAHWKYEKFASFINNMLLRRDNVALPKFQLHFESYHLINFKDVRTWITYAVNHKVEVLDVVLGRYDKSNLPRCIFTCRSLQELNLQMGEAPYDDLEHEGLIMPNKISLPSLKKLTLYDVEVDTSSLGQIIAGSPGLEYVNLMHCAQYLELVESNTLKRLTIDGFFGKGKGLTIAAPHLVHFECNGWSLEQISWQKRPSLESAQIDTLCSRGTFAGQYDFTGIILQAKRLALCGADIKVTLEKELHTCSMFDNLVSLEIGGWCLTNDLYVVVCFLQLSPRLEQLTLKQRKLNRATKEEETSSISVVGMTFECPLLEKVIIQCSMDDDKIEKIASAMVAYGISQEKIQLIFYEDIVRAERRGISLEELKKQDLEKARKENPKRVHGSNVESDNNDDDSGNMDDEEDSEMDDEYDDNDEEEMDDEDDDNDEEEMDDEDDDM